jgi:ketosteroid isomerase-like protein
LTDPREPRGHDPRTVLTHYLDALVAGDVDRIAQSFAVDATWSLHGTLPLAGEKRGRAAIMDFLLGAEGLYQPGTQEFSLGEITAEEDRAVLEWKVRGVAAATGRSYDNDYCGVFVIRDGLIVSVREYLDTQHADETLFRSSGAT